MTEEDQVSEIHAFLFDAPIAGGQTRAAQIEVLLKGARAAGLLGKGLLWVSGFITAISAAWIVLSGGGR